MKIIDVKNVILQYLIKWWLSPEYPLTLKATDPFKIKLIAQHYHINQWQPSVSTSQVNKNKYNSIFISPVCLKVHNDSPVHKYVITKAL